MNIKSKFLRTVFAFSVVAFGALGPLLLAMPSAQANPSGLTAMVYNVNGQNAVPYIPQGLAPVVTTSVSNINFQWGGGSVLGGPAEDVIVVFTGWITSDATQDISFLATGDDGTKLYVDGINITDDWRDKGGGGTTSSPVPFTAGVSKSVQLMYYENGGGANVFLYWNKSGSMEIIPASAFSYVTPPPPEVLSVGAPTNLTVVNGDSSVVLTWNAPTDGTRKPERYDVGFSCDGCVGWGVPTGNVGGPDSLKTTITLDHSLFDSLKPSGTTWTFTIRSDNDTLALYSSLSNAVTVKIGKTAEELAATQAAVAKEQVRLAEIARIEASRLEAEAAALIAAQAAAAQAEAERLAALASQAEAARLAAIAAEEARLAEVARLAAIESARIAAEQAAAAEAAQQAAAAEQARLAAIAEASRLEAERQAALAEQERLAELERQRLAEAARVEAERLAAIAAENARLAEVARQAAIAEAARIEAARVEQERLNELARIAAAKAEADRLAAEEAARIQAEKDRLAAEAAAKAEADRLAAEAAAKKAEEERIAAEIAKAKAEEEARIQAEKEAKAEADRIAAEKAAAEQKEKDRLAEEARIKAEADKKAADEARAKAEAERIAKEKADAAELKAKQEAEAAAKKPDAVTDNATADGKVSVTEAKNIGVALAAGGPVTAADIKDVVAQITSNNTTPAGEEVKLTTEEKTAVAGVLVAAFTDNGNAVPVDVLAASGIEYKDLPATTPVEVRTDDSGNEIVITAEVAADIALVTDPGALAEALFTDPGAALAALGSLGADMSEEEREESTKAVVATVVAAGAAIQAAAGAAAVATSTGGSSSSGGSSSGGGAPTGDARRRNPAGPKRIPRK